VFVKDILNHSRFSRKTMTKKSVDLLLSVVKMRLNDDIEQLQYRAGIEFAFPWYFQALEKKDEEEIEDENEQKQEENGGENGAENQENEENEEKGKPHPTEHHDASWYSPWNPWAWTIFFLMIYILRMQWNCSGVTLFGACVSWTLYNLQAINGVEAKRVEKASDGVEGDDSNVDRKPKTEGERALRGVTEEHEAAIMQLKVTANTPWESLKGVDRVKKEIEEAVMWPILHPNIFTDWLRPGKGLLIFGPPGTGKTMIGRAVATTLAKQGFSFFSVTVSAMSSKWQGDGELLMKALFAAARACSPAIVFFDEIDALLSRRSEQDSPAMQKIKNEFLSQMDGVSQHEGQMVYVIASTNRPEMLDPAAIRPGRFDNKIYLDLPVEQTRMDLVVQRFGKVKHDLVFDHLVKIVDQTEGYSGADLHEVCRQARLAPIRRLINQAGGGKVDVHKVKPVVWEDFSEAMEQVKASVDPVELEKCEKFNEDYGSFPNRSKKSKK
jgi:ATP-dependent 26S proteasome regulatory subunit